LSSSGAVVALLGMSIGEMQLVYKLDDKSQVTSQQQHQQHRSLLDRIGRKIHDIVQTVSLIKHHSSDFFLLIKNRKMNGTKPKILLLGIIEQ